MKTSMSLFTTVAAISALAASGIQESDLDSESTVVRFDFETSGQATDSGADSNSSRSDKLKSKKGFFLVRLHRAWAPWSYARFLKLLDHDYFPSQRCYRAVPGFVLDFNYAPPGGLESASSGSDPLVKFYNSGSEMPWFKPDVDDRRASGREFPRPNLAGTIVFGQEDNGETKSEVFVNLVNNSEKLDKRGFWPVGEMMDIDNKSVAQQLHGWQQGNEMQFSYGDIFFAGGASPEEASKRQQAVMNGGNEYIDRTYPGLTRITSVARVGSESKIAIII